MKIFRTNLSLSSTRDIRISNKSKNINDTLNVEWKKIPKNIKAKLKLEYIQKLKNKYSLTPKEVKTLTSLLHIAFQFHAINDCDVVFSKRRIKTIRGLKFHKSSRIFTIPDFPCDIKSKKATTLKNQGQFFSNLDKFIKECNTR